jgi:hypothetical protein
MVLESSLPDGGSRVSYFRISINESQYDRCVSTFLFIVKEAGY